MLTATYCRPSTANVIGNPVIGEPRLTSHSTSPVSASRARKRPLRSPPNTSPPPVATSDVVAARCSYFHRSSPVSGEIAWTVPSWSVPGASSLRTASAYKDDATLSLPSIAIIRAQALRRGKYISPVRGL